MHVPLDIIAIPRAMAFKSRGPEVTSIPRGCAPFCFLFPTSALLPRLHPAHLTVDSSVLRL